MSENELFQLVDSKTKEILQILTARISELETALANVVSERDKMSAEVVRLNTEWAAKVEEIRNIFQTKRGEQIKELDALRKMKKRLADENRVLKMKRIEGVRAVRGDAAAERMARRIEEAKRHE